MSEHFDAVVVGGGQAGPSMAARLSQAGQKTALVERKLLGGTCVNTGCTPTKTMIASAHAAHAVRRAAEYGVHSAGPVAVSMTEVKARKDKVVEDSRGGLTKWMASLEHCRVYQGLAARFVSPHELQVGEQTISADRVFLNVGARPAVPEMEGIEAIEYLTSSSILEMETLPEHLIIVGGGYIGLEFGQMFRRFGSQVTMVEMGSRLAKREDEDVSEALKALLEGEGIGVRCGAKCIAFAKRGERVAVRVDCESGEPEVVGTHVLLAVGRRPNTDDLGLDAAGVAMDQHGYIPVDEELRTNVPHIWALGDCNGRGAFTHTSYNDFEIVAANLLDGESRRVTDRIQAHALYTDPPLGQVGMTEAEVRSSGRPALMATRPMSKVSRAVEKGEPFGFMKALVDAETKKILGASILGTGGDEAIHAVLDAMYADAPYTVLQRAVHIHPTVSELIPTLLGDLKPLV